MRHVRLSAIIFCIIICSACTGSTSPTTSAPTAEPTNAPLSLSMLPLDGVLTVAWVVNNIPFVWQSDNPDAIRQLNADDVSQVVVAPDGERLILVREYQSESHSLWLANVNGGDLQPISQDVIPDADNEAVQIRQIVWIDDNSLLFNTSEISGDFYGVPRNDLYRVDIGGMTVERLLSAGEGGAFTLSPNRQQVAITFPGVYNEPNGAVRVYTLTGNGGLTTVLNFDGVATGSHFPFYPRISWVSDTRFNVAIPHPDQLYNENEDDAPPFALYTIDNGEDAQQIGTIPGSLFGVPAWAVDGSQMAYLRRDTPNTFEIVVAITNGDDQTVVARSDVGNLVAPQWTQQGHLVSVTTQVNVLRPDGSRGEVETPPVAGVPVVAGDVTVFSTFENGEYAIHYVTIDDDTLAPVTLIAGLTRPRISAVFVPD